MPLSNKQIAISEQIKTAVAKANVHGLQVERISAFGAYWVFPKSDLSRYHVDHKKNRVRITSASKLLEYLEEHSR